MPGPTDFAKLVPGFDFLQGLMKSAGSTLPNMGQWIAPTLDPADIEKRIEQLRTVQFWLEQNAKMLGATIQALEVQRMTLATLKGMNLPLDDVRQAFTLGPPAAAPQADAAAAKPRAKAAAKSAPAGAANAAADPMQWWGALTQQFTELATHALRDSSAEAARHLAGQALKSAVGAASTAATSAAATAAATAATAAKLPARVVRARKRAG
jgi:hypothetical protein